MTGIFLGAVSLMYLFAAANYIYTGNVGMGIAFLSYAIANYGLWMAS